MSEDENIREEGLKEGESYLFFVQKVIALPGSGEEHFILIGPDEKKYLLKASHYRHYGIKPGLSIRCSVDKINCTGQVFLEPEHPYYQPGNRYDFLVTRLTTENSIFGSVNDIAWVRDLHRFEWPCQIDSPEFLEPGISHLSCRVERIKKAQLILSLPSMRGSKVKLRRGTVYSFTIKEVREFQSVWYYIIEDPHGSYHPLLKKNFEHFNYHPGQIIQVRVVDLQTDGSYILEPINPYYRAGEVYLFKFLRMERYPGQEFEGQDGVIWVEDHFGQAIKVRPRSWQLSRSQYSPEHITCKVTKFKRGKLVLENLTEPDE